MPQTILNVVLIVAVIVLVVLLAFARTWMRRAVYNKMNQPGKQKSAIQKWFGW